MIRLSNVRKVYRTKSGPNVVLRDVNLTVNAGETVGIVGFNGAGKSTLVRLISGADTPTSGTIESEMSVSWPIAFGGGIHPRLSGTDNLRFICRIYGVDYADKLKFVQEFSGLGAYLDEPVANYSSGMRARLAFAVSMAVEFDCYLIDEVVAVGDEDFRAKCDRELFGLRRDRAKIIISHSFRYLRSHCERFVLLHDGILTEFGSAEEVQREYKRLQKVRQGEAKGSSKSTMKAELLERKREMLREKTRIREMTTP